MRRYILLFFYLAVFVPFASKASDPRCCPDKEITDSYSINLTWINNKLDPDQKYIFPANESSDLNSKYLDYARTWCSLNPVDGGGVINIWYDSVMTTPEAIEATREEIGCFPINLRDMRDIPTINDNEDIFTDELPVYFRTDLARVIISEYEVQSQPDRTFIFANCNMPPISKELLFDVETVEKIKKFGLVMGFNCTGSNKSNADATSYENSFFMLSGCDQLMLDAINNVLIHGCLSVARLAIEDRDEYDFYTIARKGRGLSDSLSQFVYGMYGKLYTYYYAKKLGLTLGVEKRRRKFEKFGDSLNTKDFFRGRFDILESEKALEEKILLDGLSELEIVVPIKKVSLPTAKRLYYTTGLGNDPSYYR